MKNKVKDEEYVGSEASSAIMNYNSNSQQNELVQELEKEKEILQ
jgi:hypothetical protein